MLPVLVFAGAEFFAAAVARDPADAPYQRRQMPFDAVTAPLVNSAFVASPEAAVGMCRSWARRSQQAVLTES
jgi:hypothetical protein